jgi:hypothetical protein
MQTDETLQSPWQPIGGVIGSIYGKSSDGTIYGIDTSQNAFQFNGKVSPLYTDGLNPSSLYVDSHSNQLWMTTNTPGSSGNIFTRAQKPDYSSIMNTITPLNNVRDKIVDSVETKYNRQTDVMTVNKQVEDVVTYFKRMFNIDKDTAKKANNQSGHLNETIRESQIQLEQINNISPFILGIIIILIVVIFVYLFGSMFLGNYVHGVALGIIGIGMAFLLNFSGTIK